MAAMHEHAMTNLNGIAGGPRHPTMCILETDTAYEDLFERAREIVWRCQQAVNTILPMDLDDSPLYIMRMENGLVYEVVSVIPADAAPVF